MKKPERSITSAKESAAVLQRARPHPRELSDRTVPALRGGATESSLGRLPRTPRPTPCYMLWDMNLADGSADPWRKGGSSASVARRISRAPAVPR